MRLFFLITIIFVVAVIGFFVYTEFRNWQFAKDLPPVPVEQSSRQTNQLSLDFGSENLTDERRASALEGTEDGVPDFQQKTFVPEGSTPDAFHQKAVPPAPVNDWRNDDAFIPPRSRDPWHPEDMSMKFVDFDKLSEKEQLSIAHKSLLGEFGDIPQVRVVMAFDNRPKDAPIPIDEAIAHSEACLYLWPDEGTRQSIVQLKALKASGFRAFPPTGAH